jgi:riboflavin transporter FmnP
LSIILGTLSILLGTIKFQIPELEGTESELREIPLLISLFYIKNPLLLILESAITASTTPTEASMLANFLMHVVALCAGGFLYHRYGYLLKGSIMTFLGWMVFTIFLYVVFYLPVLAFFDYLIGMKNYEEAFSSYLMVLKSIRFEILITGIVTGLFLIQLRTKQSLEVHKEELEERIENRTSQLAMTKYNLMSVNKALLSNNEEITVLNEDLDEIIKKRTDKVKEQLNQLIKFANLNACEVNEPLSKIVELIPSISQENNAKKQYQMMKDLEKYGNELDNIIKNMNVILESEVAVKSEW